jgi:hypothetical protein
LLFNDLRALAHHHSPVSTLILTMKFSTAVCALLASSAAAFAPSAHKVGNPRKIGSKLANYGRENSQILA